MFFVNPIWYLYLVWLNKHCLSLSLSLSESESGSIEICTILNTLDMTLCMCSGCPLKLHMIRVSLWLSNHRFNVLTCIYTHITLGCWIMTRVRLLKQHWKVWENSPCISTLLQKMSYDLHLTHAPQNPNIVRILLYHIFCVTYKLKNSSGNTTPITMSSNTCSDDIL